MTEIASAPILPYAFSRTHGVIIFEASDGSVAIGGRPDAHPMAMVEAQRLAPPDLPFIALEHAQFDETLSRLHQSNARRAADLAAESDTDLAALADSAAAVEDILDDTSDAPVVRLINAILAEAIREAASDIHIEPHESRLVIRFRIDGVLRDRLEPNLNLAPMLVGRIKVMAGLDVAEKRKPHDGRVSLRVGKHEIDIRVSTVPSQYGERVVLRILDRSNARFELTDLGMTANSFASLERLLARPSGIILVTGPTGSGKTTTLYASIGRLNDRQRNIMTVEDPIEYALDGIGQIQVNPQKGVTFASGVRALMRQDPNVILIGEIRDAETAAAAIRAATSGHLVLATLHTTSAIGAVTRLSDMGVERYLLAPVLEGVVAQRLVRRLCETCREPDRLSELDASRLGGLAPVGAEIFRAKGCDACQGQGYRGRTAIYEIVEMGGPFEKLIHESAPETELVRLARKKSPSLISDGVGRILEGVTTVEEVAAVADARE